MNATYKLINEIRDLGLIKEFAFFIEVKKLYVSGVIYQPNKLYQKLNCSRTKVTRHLKIFLEQGWSFYHSGNLCLKSMDKIHLLYNVEPSKYKTKINNIHDIYLVLLKNKLQQKAYISRKISGLNSYSKRVVKSTLKFLKERNIPTDKARDNNKIGIPLKSISVAFNLSKSQTSRILSEMNRKLLISVIRQRKLMGEFNLQLFNIIKEQFKGLYVSKGYMWYNLPSMIRIRQNNINENNIIS